MVQPGERITGRRISQKMAWGSLKNYNFIWSESRNGWSNNINCLMTSPCYFFPFRGPSPSGVVAMGLSPNGSLFNDFIFDGGRGVIGPNMLHVRNAPSPAATSSLAIAEELAEEAEKRFNLSRL